MASFDRGYALAVGIANYPHVRQLPATVLKDATDIGALLVHTGHCGYPPDQVKRLLDAQATAANIRAGLQWLAAQTGPDGTALFYFSGHGGRIEGGRHTENYLIPFDTVPADLEKTAIDSQELTGLLGNIRAGRLLVLFDCCHAAGAGEIKDSLDEATPGFKSGLEEQYYARLATGRGRVIIASSRSTEKSWLLPDLPNSLFTHYLLAALRGQARTYGDGLIRVLDVFNLIAEKVPERQPRQHPILKAELETNFPIALHRGRKRHHRRGIIKPTIEHSPNLSLPPEAGAVLKAIFGDYERVVIKKRFEAGFSGGQVFLTRPIKDDRTPPELPTVVKIASVSLIEKEWQAYRTFIRDRLPNSIGISGNPVLPAGYWGGLRYPLFGGGAFAIDSLRNYCRYASLDSIHFVLEKRLLKIVEQLAQFNRFSPAFNLQASYDPLLPLNLLVQPTSLPAETEPQLLTPDTSANVSLTQGDYVRLSGFVISKVDLLDDTVTLNLPSSPEGAPVSYSLRLTSAGPLASYRVNQTIEPIEGVVLETRQERLEAEAKRALGTGFDPAGETLSLPDGTKLPNPLAALPTISGRFPDVKVGHIHGDLNLENILVDPATRDVSLIDFANAREDHLLHDFLRLETEIVTKLIPEILTKANLGAGVICSFYEQLHDAVVQPGQPASDRLPHSMLEKPFAMLAAIRKTARRFLFNIDDWTEYYQGLVIYLLGAMKFANLDSMAEAPAPLPKQVAFLGAGTVVGLVEQLSEPALTRPAALKQRRIDAIVPSHIVAFEQTTISDSVKNDIDSLKQKPPSTEQISVGNIKTKSEQWLGSLSTNINNVLGLLHIERVLNYSEEVIGLAEAKNLRLSHLESLVLQASVYLRPLSLTLTNLPTSPFLKKTYPNRNLGNLSETEKLALLYKHHLDLTDEILTSYITRPEELASLGLDQANQARIIASVIKAGTQPLQEVPETTVLDGQTVRLRLLSAFFRLADALDTDTRGFNAADLTAANLTHEMKVYQTLRQYVEGIIISEREIRLYYIVPDDSYVAPLKTLISGGLLRIHLETAPIFSQYGWLLPPLTSQVEIGTKPLLPIDLLDLLRNRDWLINHLKPLTEVLGETESSIQFSDLYPYHFGKIRTLKTFSWKLGLDEGATYEIKLKNLESKETLLEVTTNTCQLNYPSDAPQLRSGNSYQWSIKGKKDGKRARALGFFELLASSELTNLVEAEQIVCKLAQPERQLALGALYKSRELYGEAVQLLKELIEICDDPSTILLARRILAEVYEAIYLALRKLRQFKKADLFLQESKYQYSLIHEVLMAD